MTRSRVVQNRCAITVTTSVTAGNQRPIGWVGGVNYWQDEPVADVLGALDAVLAQIRAQAEIDIRETCR